MIVANVENNTLNWMSISSARALDMTDCDFDVRSARDGSSKPYVIIGPDKDQNKGCKKKNKDLTSELNKGTSHVQDEMGKLMHHDEHALLSLWEGWHWDDTKGGWLDPELCARARRLEVEYIRRQKMYTRVTREARPRDNGESAHH